MASIISRVHFLQLSNKTVNSLFSRVTPCCTYLCTNSKKMTSLQVKLPTYRKYILISAYLATFFSFGVCDITINDHKYNWETLIEHIQDSSSMTQKKRFHNRNEMKCLSFFVVSVWILKQNHILFKNIFKIVMINIVWGTVCYNIV